MTPRLLLIDNYDSFTYNLVQAFLVLGAEVLVYRNDAITVAAALALAPTHLCISPGPGTPYDAGISMDMIRAFAGRVPVLGVCLGHQSIVEVFGGKVVRARTPDAWQDLARSITTGAALFADLPQACEVGRYHSLIADAGELPAELKSAPARRKARSWASAIARLTVEGVQFHPESILSPDGPRLLGNFLTKRSRAMRRDA